MCLCLINDSPLFDLYLPLYIPTSLLFFLWCTSVHFFLCFMKRRVRLMHTKFFIYIVVLMSVGIYMSLFTLFCRILFPGGTSSPVFCYSIHVMSNESHEKCYSLHLVFFFLFFFCTCYLVIAWTLLISCCAFFFAV